MEVVFAQNRQEVPELSQPLCGINSIQAEISKKNILQKFLPNPEGPRGKVIALM